MTQRPPFIQNVRDLDRTPTTYDGLPEEVFGERARISRPLGLERLGVHYDRLAPGQRSSLPHAESLEEEMIYVISGTPFARLDGVEHRLGPGDVVVFVPGTGLSHTIVNDTEAPVELLSMGERHPDNQWRYPENPERRAFTPEGRWWEEE